MKICRSHIPFLPIIPKSRSLFRAVLDFLYVFDAIFDASSLREVSMMRP
jgi:hypothetical protein